MGLLGHHWQRSAGGIACKYHDLLRRGRRGMAVASTGILSHFGLLVRLPVYSGAAITSSSAYIELSAQGIVFPRYKTASRFD